MNKILIGIAGRAGSGKSTCAKWLTDNYSAVEFSFAKPLKNLARELFDLSEEQVNGTQAQKEAIDPRYGVSPRQLMIRLGDGARRYIAEDIWIRGCLRQVEKSDSLVCLVSDVRYPNESKAIRAAGGIVVRLKCSDAQTLVDPNAGSEKGVDEIDPNDVHVELNIPRSPGAKNLIDAFAAAITPYLCPLQLELPL